jgi:hypothetical protein
MQNQPPFSLKGSYRLIVSSALTVLVAIAQAGCSLLPQTPLPTPLPSEYIPTAVALTMAAGQTPLATPTPQTEPSESTSTPEVVAIDLPTASATPLPPCTGDACIIPTPTPTGPSATPFTLQPSPTTTPTPQVPNAEIEIRNLGPLSRVKSPLHVFLYLKPGAGGKVRIELYGEDNRVLYREIRKINFVPIGAWATFTVDFEFEIAAAAEVGRLKISVDDEFGRTVALNSVPLILLSVGDADIVPPQDVLAPIIIRQPRRKALIQGGKLVVSGLARPSGDGTLMVKLITAKGSEPGFRLAEVDPHAAGDYGTFAIEVPYTVSEPTSALLVVLEGGGSLTDVIHLSSIEVLLSP